MLRSLLPRTRSAFESRTEIWREVGLGSEIDQAAARRGRGGALIVAALIAGVLVLFTERKTLFPGYGLEVRVATVVLLILLGWALARSLGRGVAPTLYRRLEPGTAGTIGFLMRLLTIVVATVVALRIAGLGPSTLAVGGGFMVPNGVLSQCAVTPLREPERVEFRARFGAETSPREVQEMIESAISVPLRYPPHIAVEELDRDEVVVRTATATEANSPHRMRRCRSW